MVAVVASHRVVVTVVASHHVVVSIVASHHIAVTVVTSHLETDVTVAELQKNISYGTSTERCMRELELHCLCTQLCVMSVRQNSHRERCHTRMCRL